MNREPRLARVEMIKACIEQRPYVNLEGAKREVHSLLGLNPTPEQEAALNELAGVLSKIHDERGLDLTRDDLSGAWSEISRAKQAVLDLYVDETGQLLPLLK